VNVGPVAQGATGEGIGLLVGCEVAVMGSSFEGSAGVCVSVLDRVVAVGDGRSAAVQLQSAGATIRIRMPAAAVAFENRILLGLLCLGVWRVLRRAVHCRLRPSRAQPLRTCAPKAADPTIAFVPETGVIRT
jgi:hypothetical protein